MADPKTNLKSVLLVTTALVGVMLLDGAAAGARADQASGCTPSAANSAGTVRCTAAGNVYPNITYSPPATLNLTVDPGVQIVNGSTATASFGILILPPNNAIVPSATVDSAASITTNGFFGGGIRVGGNAAQINALGVNSSGPIAVTGVANNSFGLEILTGISTAAAAGGSVSVTNSGPITVTPLLQGGLLSIDTGIAASLSDGAAATNGKVTIDNSASVTVSASPTGPNRFAAGLAASGPGAGTTVTVTNSGQVSAPSGTGVSATAGSTGSLSVVNSGALSSLSGVIGVAASTTGAGITITNQGTITGSNVAVIGTTSGVGGTAGRGTILIDNAGRIVSTAANNPVAIQLDASDNTLLLEPGQSITGLVTQQQTSAGANATTRVGIDTLNLGGTGTGAFDASQIGLTPSQQGYVLDPATNKYTMATPNGAPTQTQQYQNFSTFVKSGASTWVLTYGTGGGLADQNWAIAGGTLQGDTTSIRGATITDGATLAFVQDFAGTYAGTVVDGAAPGALVKGGAGTLTLTGANTYTGGTFLNGGVLQVAADRNLGGATGGLTFDGGTLRFGASFDPAAGRAVTLNAGGGTIDTNGFNAAMASAITGAGMLTKAGAGTLTLTGANTYAGGTLLQAGTLAVGGPSALGTGTLRSAGGMLAAATDATLGNALALDTTLPVNTGSAALTLAGTVSGAGGIIKTGAGTLALTGANTYAGGTAVKAGTLAVGNASALGAGTLSLADGTGLTFTSSFTLANAVVFAGTADPTFDTGANTDTVSGVISGAGALTKAGTGTLILTGANTYAGGTTVAAGTLRGTATSFGSGAIADDGRLVIDQAGDASFGNAISGTGSLVKAGAGTLTLTGNSALAGPTTVKAGGLAVLGRIASSTVTVASGATLSGTGTVGGVAAQGGATVAPGTAANSYGVLRVSGDVAFAPGSTFAVSVDPTGRNSAIAAGGAASITGGTVAVQGGTGTYDPGTRYTLLTAARGVGGAFSSLSTTSNLAFLDPFLSYDANDVYLGFARNQVSFPNVGATRNQRAAAGGIQGLGAGNSLYDAVLGLSAGQARAAFDASSGEIHASAVTAGFEDTRLVREAILNRLHAAARDGVEGRTDGAVATDLPPTFVPVAPYTLWGQGFGDFGYNGSDRNAATLERSLGGFVLGGDMLGPAALGPWRIGVAGGYTNDTLTVGKRASSGTFETGFGALYSGAQYGALDLRVGTSFGGTSTGTSRVTALPGFRDGNTANYGGSIVQGFGEAGYRFQVGRGIVEPLGTAAVVHIHQDGFREDGGAAALVGTGRDYDLGTTTLGLKGEMPLVAGLPLFGSGFLGWRHAFGDLTPGALLRFGTGTTPFEVFGAPIDRDALSAQAAIDYRATSALTVEVSYSGQVGERAEDQAVRGRMEYRF